MIRDSLAGPHSQFLHLKRLPDGNVEVGGVAEATIGLQVPAAESTARPDGSWVRWHWDGKTLTVENDALGYRTLYVAADHDSICIAPDLAEVVARTGRRSWNPTAIAVFCRAGLWPGNETAFEGVQTLPPNSTLTWSNGRKTLVTSVLEVERLRLTRDQAMDEFVRRFRGAIARRIAASSASPVWVPLSGGKDSRYLLLELRRVGVTPRCITARYRPPGTTEDADIAGRLCAALGLEHETLVTTRDWLAGELRKNRLLSFASAAHSWFIPLAERMTSVGGVAYDGIGGDNTISGYFLDPPVMDDIAHGRFSAVAERFAPESQERALRRWFGDDLYVALPRRAAIDRLAEDIASYRHRPSPISAWAMEGRGRRGVAVTQYGFLRRLSAVMSPYMDVDVYRLSVGVPWEILADKQVHAAIIEREFPEVATVPFAVRGEQQRAGAAREHRRRARHLTAYLASRPTSSVLNFSYLFARTLRSAIDGSVVPAIPVLILQLERELGLRPA